MFTRLGNHRLLIIDFCGTLSSQVVRFDVDQNLKDVGLSEEGYDSKWYWETCQRTWSECSTTPVRYTDKLLEATGSAHHSKINKFMSNYWNYHVIQEDWKNELKGADIQIAVSAAVGFPKKDPRFWESILSNRPSSSNQIIIASDHYIEAVSVIKHHFSDVASSISCWSRESVSTTPTFNEIIVIDDFGSSEQSASGYAERSAVTEAAIRKVIPTDVKLLVHHYYGATDGGTPKKSLEEIKMLLPRQ